MTSSDELIGVLEGLTSLGRSSRYSLRRHAALHGARYARLLEGPAPRGGPAWARRGRLLRILGRKTEAAEAFDRALALSPRLGRLHAWRWEAGGPTAGIDAAISLEPGEPRWRLWRGLSRLTRGRRADLAAALFDLEAATTLDRTRALSWAGLALARSAQRRPKEALAALDRAVVLEPRQAWLRRLRARLRWAAGDRRGFLSDCEAEVMLEEGAGTFALALGSQPRYSPRRLLAAADRYLAAQPKAYWMLVLRGDCRRSPEVNDFAGALADFEAAVALRPDCAWAWAYLSRARMTNASAASALEAVERAAALAPDCGWLRVWHGEVLRRLGRGREALRALDRGLALDPDYEFGYAWRGGALRTLRRPRRALADLDVAAALDPSYAWTFYERSLTQRELGRFAEAFSDLETACRLDAKYAWCARTEAAPAALAELERALAQDPRSAWAYAWRGELKLRLSDPRGAQKDLARALKLRPGLPWVRAWRARALDALGRPAQALRELDRAIAQDARYAPAYAWRGLLRRGTGRLRGALADLDQALRLDPNSTWALYWKGEVALRLGRRKQARRDLTRVLGMDPRNADARALLERAGGASAG